MKHFPTTVRSEWASLYPEEKPMPETKGPLSEKDLEVRRLMKELTQAMEVWTHQMENVPGRPSYQVTVPVPMTLVPTRLLTRLTYLMRRLPLHPDLHATLNELIRCANDVEEPKGR